MESNDSPNNPTESSTPANSGQHTPSDSIKTPWNVQLAGLGFRNPGLDDSFNKCLEQYRELYRWKMAAYRCSLAMTGTDISTPDKFLLTQVEEFIRLKNKIEAADREIAKRDEEILKLQGTIAKREMTIDRLRNPKPA